MSELGLQFFFIEKLKSKLHAWRNLFIRKLKPEQLLNSDKGPIINSKTLNEAFFKHLIYIQFKYNA